MEIFTREMLSQGFLCDTILENEGPSVLRPCVPLPVLMGTKNPAEQFPHFTLRDYMLG
jgi:hypothetical protein